MAPGLENDPENNNKEYMDEELKSRAKKGVSITISLVMLGFTGWKDLEPGKIICPSVLYKSISFMYNCLLMASNAQR